MASNTVAGVSLEGKKKCKGSETNYMRSAAGLGCVGIKLSIRTLDKNFEIL